MSGQAFPKAGLHHVSLSDYPGHVSAIVFFTGCNFSCPYCHNPELARGLVPEDFLAFDEILHYLETHRGKLDGVVLTGGEPTLQRGLLEIISLFHELGFKVKVDTNGSNPEALLSLDADFYALDIKTDFRSYHKLLCSSAPQADTELHCPPSSGLALGNAQARFRADDYADRVRRSLDSIRASGKPYEVRITCAPGFIGMENIHEIASYFLPHETVVLQRYRASDVLDPQWERKQIPYTETQYAELLAALRRVAPNASLR